ARGRGAGLRGPAWASGVTLPPPRLEPRRPPPSFAATPAPPRTTPTVDLPRMPPRLVPEPHQTAEPTPASEPQVTPELRLEPRLGEPRPPVEPRPAPEPKADGSPADKPAFESLEREMASLLGRPPRGRTSRRGNPVRAVRGAPAPRATALRSGALQDA